MKIYRDEPEDGKFRSFLRDDSESEFVPIDLDGTRRLSNWVAPTVYVDRPRMKYGDFCHYWGGAGIIAVAPRAVEAVRTVLAPEDELLPFEVAGETFHFINIVGITDCFADANSVWSNPELKVTILKYAFRAEAIRKPLFKIPVFNGLETFAVDATGDPNVEFKAMVEARHLTGIRFDEVWSSES